MLSVGNGVDALLTAVACRWLVKFARSDCTQCGTSCQFLLKLQVPVATYGWNGAFVHLKVVSCGRRVFEALEEFGSLLSQSFTITK